MEDLREIIKKDGRKYSIRSNRNRIFLPSEWIRFYKELKDSQKITFDILINTGARINEVINIKVEDIDFINKTITIRKTKRRNLYADGKIRIITISNKLSKILEKYIKKKELHAEDRLGLLSKPACHIALKNALKRANFKDWYMFSIHNIRKTLESWLLEINVDGLKLCKHFGHSREVALRYYLKDISLLGNERNKIRHIIGNLYFTNGDIDRLYTRIKLLENKLEKK